MLLLTSLFAHQCKNFVYLQRQTGHRLRDSGSFPTVVSVVWRFPRGPVGPYRARPQPLPVHQRDGVLRLHLLGEAHEAVAFGAILK